MPVPLEEALKADPPCYPRACAIQTCLQRSQYNEARCQEQMDALLECCTAFYARSGPDAKSVCCMKKSLLDLKVKQRAEGKGGGAEVIQASRRQ